MTVSVRQRGAFAIALRPRHKLVGHAPDTLVAQCRWQDGRGEVMKLCYGISRQLTRLREQAKRLKWQHPGESGKPLKERASFHL
jgi:hypothetical protein